MNRTLRIQISCANQLRFIIFASILWLACISLTWLTPDRLEIVPVMLQAAIIGFAVALIFGLPAPLGYLAFRLAVTERGYLRDHVASTVVAFVCVTAILTLYFFLVLPSFLRTVA